MGYVFSLGNIQSTPKAATEINISHYNVIVSNILSLCYAPMQLICFANSVEARISEETDI